MFKKSIALFFASVVLGGCAGNNISGLSSGSEFKQKESLYQTTDNQVALISLYRDSLQKSENDEIRLKLARSYYSIGDSDSALLYLKPLLNKRSSITESAKLLQIRSLIQSTKYQEAVETASALIRENPKSSEAYNLRGIANAQLGNISEAHSDIMSAREYFINDSVALNNLAMIYIIDGQYDKAAETLMPQYMSDVKEPRLVYNLVFALVKSGHIEHAKNIIQKENLHPSPDELIIILTKVNTLPFTN